MRARIHIRLAQYALLTWLLMAASACVQLAGYDQKAYENATSLKAATLALLQKSARADSFKANEAAVDQLLVNLSAAYEYADGIEYNNEAAKNWRDLIGNDDEFIKGWIALWSDAGSVSRASVQEFRTVFAEGFDTIICLEANKRQLTSCESLKRTANPAGE